ncbi:hypothetical protein BDV93DRAFT_559949 [Ceratobasidium sp. AG-I]|nr:hypothetical protein BDV93DRAFT_559949 [Ceratobasidium sp. AG-I]
MAATNRKNTSDNGKGKAPAKKRQRNDDIDSNDDRVGGQADENASDADRPKKCPRKETARKRASRQNDKDDRKVRHEHRQATDQRRQERADEQAASIFVEEDDETERETLLQSFATGYHVYGSPGFQRPLETAGQGSTGKPIWERIPRFRRFANNWAGELVVQDVFNHRHTHMLKLERESKTPGKCRPADEHSGTSKEVNSKNPQRNQASNRQRLPGDHDDDDLMLDSQSSPDRGRNSSIGWTGPPVASSAASPVGSPAMQAERERSGNAAQEEGEGVPRPRQDGAGLSRGQAPREAEADAHATNPHRSNRRSRPSLAAAAIAAAKAAAEDDDDARKARGGDKKGGKGKAKAKQGGDQELYPEEGEEYNNND